MESASTDAAIHERAALTHAAQTGHFGSQWQKVRVPVDRRFRLAAPEAIHVARRAGTARLHLALTKEAF